MTAAAARLDDPISHTSAMGGLLAGLAIGAGVAVAGIAIVGTGGLAVGPIVGAVAAVGAGASAGAGIGQVIGSLSAFTSETGMITTASPNVRINGKPAARAHADYVDCDKHDHGRQVIAQGSAGVRINGFPAARVGDKTACGATISSGSSNVRIGGETVQTDEIEPEVPAWLEWTIAGVGIASAFVLASPAVATLGLLGGSGGGAGGHWLGGEIFDEGSDGQKLMTLAGAFVGGFAGARGAQALGARKAVLPEKAANYEAPSYKKPQHSLSEAVGRDTADNWISSAKAKADKNNFDISRLSEDEVGAIYGYTTNEGYTALNPALRGQTEFTSELKSFSTHLSNGLSKLEPAPGIYTRGSSPPRSVADEYQIGNTVSDAAYKSTSNGNGFDGYLQEKVTSYSGRDISKLSAYESELEVLHFPGTKFVVNNRIEQGDTVIVVLQEAL